MSDLPSGTVTFLFTDIEGSTRLAREHQETWETLRARHHTLLRKAIESNHGTIFQVVGDAFCAAFENAGDALQAAYHAQQALQHEPWGEAAIHVRMGLHTGEVKVVEGEFHGYLTLSLAQRIMSVGHGGQVLVSEETEDLLRSQLPKEIRLQDMGKHKLKDIPQPVRFFQLVAKDLRSEFPALETKDFHPNNLPTQVTSFVGRQKELEDVKKLIREARVLTLTGAGGSGKTRLALQAATEMLNEFEDGVFFVALAPISDPGLVASTIARSLGLAETAGRSILESLKDYLQNKSLLLLLDNFEQVTSAVPAVAEILAACSKVKVFATSREALHISGEREVPVLPLAHSSPAPFSSRKSLAESPAVDLFVQRARAVKPDFEFSNETAPAIAEICHRLDGLPLAIELAAARSRLLSPTALLARLEHRLDFLTGGARDLPARQQTLRNAIAWSYDLLDENEQRFFRELSVFVGGCMLEAAESMVRDRLDSASMLNQLESLVDKSLLREVAGMDDEPRFAMLETLREFGLQQLEASGEQDIVCRRHADFYLALAEGAEASLESTEQVKWMDRMEQEHDNLRAALEWTRTAAGAGETCLRLAGALGLFWEVRGHFSEGRERLSAVLSTKGAQGETAARARLLARAAELAYRQSDYPATSSFAEEGLRIYRKLGDHQGIASALIKLGNSATERGSYASASRFLEEALTIWREHKDKHGTARALISLGWAALRAGDTQLANERLEEALALSRELGDARSMGFELSGLGEIALRQGDYARATQLMEESLEVRRQLGNKWGVGVSLGMLGWVAVRERDWDRAIARIGESLKVRQEIGDKGGCAWCLERLAGICMVQGQPEKAVQLLGAAAALRSSIGSVIDPVDQANYKKNLDSLRTKLGKARFKTDWDKGHAMTMEQAVAYALQN
ncbi:MAG: tetratricopeptide repeat protein [Chloroflexota bacterium]